MTKQEVKKSIQLRLQKKFSPLGFKVKTSTDGIECIRKVDNSTQTFFISVASYHPAYAVYPVAHVVISTPQVVSLCEEISEQGIGVDELGKNYSFSVFFRTLVGERLTFETEGRLSEVMDFYIASYMNVSLVSFAQTSSDESAERWINTYQGDPDTLATNPLRSLIRMVMTFLYNPSELEKVIEQAVDEVSRFDSKSKRPVLLAAEYLRRKSSKIT